MEKRGGKKEKKKSQGKPPCAESFIPVRLLHSNSDPAEICSDKQLEFYNDARRLNSTETLGRYFYVFQCQEMPSCLYVFYCN